MAAVMTPTQFNRERSKAVRTARDGTPVVVMPSDGDTADALVLIRLDQAQLSPIELALISGGLQAAKNPQVMRFPVAKIDRKSAKAALAEFEGSRDAGLY